MEGCKWCGKKTELARQRKYRKIFCDNKCKQKYSHRRMAPPEASIMNRIYGDEVGMHEAIERKRLLAGARIGKKRAIRVLKQKYNLTGLWNGQEIVRL
mgnify:CR=1 FL=1